MIGLRRSISSRLRPRLELARSPRGPAPRSSSDRPLSVAQRARLGGLAEVLEGLDAQLLVDLAHGLRTEAGDPQQLDQAGRDLLAEPVVVAPCRPVVASSAILSLIALPTPGIRGRSPDAVRAGHVERGAADGVGGPVVGDGLEDELALDLEDVADLVEDPGEVAVGGPARLRRLGGLLAVGVAGGLAGVGGFGGLVGRAAGRGTGRLAGHGPMVASAAGPGRGRPPGPYPATTRSRPAASPRRAPGRRPRRGRRSAGPARRPTATPTDTLTARTPNRREVQRADRRPHALADLDRHLRRRVAQQDGELLAAEAGRDVVLANGARDRAADRSEHLVAHGVAVRVVEPT